MHVAKKHTVVRCTACGAVGATLKTTDPCRTAVDTIWVYSGVPGSDSVNAGCKLHIAGDESLPNLRYLEEFLPADASSILLMALL